MADLGMLNSEQLNSLSDRDLLAHSRAYEAHITADGASLNMGTPESDAIKDLNNTFEDKCDAWDAVQLEEAGIATAKGDGRKAVLAELRRQRNVSYADTSITDAARSAAGMPPRDTTKTAPAAPTTAPVAWIDYGKLKHTIHFRDSATPDSSAKPAGMRGAEIWRSVGDGTPASESDYDFVALDSATPYVATYPMADGGKRVLYILRWVSTRDDKGEWSETVEATING